MEDLKLTAFTKEELDKIHQATLEILREPGILVDSQEARDLLEKNGCKVNNETKMVSFPEEVVKKGLSTVPDHFTLYSRDGKHNVEFVSDGSQVHNNTFGIGTQIIEYLGNGQFKDRASTLQDLGDICKVANYCDNIDFFCSPVSAMDHADDPVRTLREMKAILVNSAKPIDLDSEAEFFPEYFDLVAACYGGDRERAMREPVNTVGCCPASPLQLDAELCATALTGPKYGMPVNILSMAMSAASSPVFLAGTLVTHNAEVIAGIVLTQLAFPGHPMIYGSSTTCFDFFSTTAPVGSPELGLIGAGVAALAEYYHIPSIVAGA